MRDRLVARGKIYSILTQAVPVVCAYAFDLLGEPPAAVHPVVWYGRGIRLLESCAPEESSLARFCYGVGMLGTAGAVVAPLTLLVQRLTRFMRGTLYGPNPKLWRLCLATLSEGALLKPFFALRMLADAGRAVRVPLARGDMDGARAALQSLVSRDRAQLSSELVAAAAIESLAENLSDSVVAPLFYYCLFNLPGAALYRLVNTLDSMIGYHGEYEYLGKAAARLDDVLNFIPARLTALFIFAAAPLFGGERRRAWSVWRHDAHKTASPNAGHPMAATAGALGVRLEKVGFYTLGTDLPQPRAQHIEQAERMVWMLGGLIVLCVALYKGVWGIAHERSVFARSTGAWCTRPCRVAAPGSRARGYS